jgi:hypothetical protein
VLALGTTGVAAPPATAAPSHAWLAEPALPLARFGQVAGTLPDGRVIVAAGFIPSPYYPGFTATFEVDVLDPVTHTWSAGPSLPIQPTYDTFSGVVGTDGRFYLFPKTGQVDIFDPVANSWSLGPTMPNDVNYRTAAALPDGRLMVIGGLSQSTGQDVQDVYALTPSTGTWAPLAPLPTGCQSMGAGTGPDGLVYVAGGACNSPSWSNLLWIYHPTTDGWTSGNPMPTGQAWPGAAFGGDGRLYVVGGYNDGGVSATSYAYDPATTQWATVSDLPAPVYQHAATELRGGSILVLGGCGGTCPSDAVWKLPITGHHHGA